MSEGNLGNIVFVFEVYNVLGPGLLESVYERALAVELQSNGLQVECQLPLNVNYKEIDLGVGFRLDIMVNKQIVIEVKSVEELSPFHHKQLLNYLKLTGLHLGILVNFNTSHIDKNIIRLISGYK